MLEEHKQSTGSTSLLLQQKSKVKKTKTKHNKHKNGSQRFVIKVQIFNNLNHINGIKIIIGI